MSAGVCARKTWGSMTDSTFDYTATLVGMSRKVPATFVACAAVVATLVGIHTKSQNRNERARRNEQRFFTFRLVPQMHPYLLRHVLKATTHQDHIKTSPKFPKMIPRLNLRRRSHSPTHLVPRGQLDGSLLRFLTRAPVTRPRPWSSQVR